MTNTKYIVSLSFLGSQAKSNKVFKVYLLVWESQYRNECFGAVTHDWILIV